MNDCFVLQIGLKFYDDFLTKIPRYEVHEIIQRVRSAANRLYGKGIISIIGAGSFRRGYSECGDVDILITRLVRDLKILKFKLLKTNNSL